MNNIPDKPLPCPFCGSIDIEIFIRECDHCIKDIVAMCADCWCHIEKDRINIQNYFNGSSVDEAKFKSDAYEIGLKTWNRRA